MKKLLALLITVIMSVSLFTGCGADPVYDDFTKFLNVEMAQVNKNYTKITTEVGKWEEAEDDAALAKSLEEVLIPLVDDSLAILDKINPATDEVTEIKDKYVKVMDAYKKGFEALLEGCNTQDEATINSAQASIDEGITYLDEYNKALEDFAKAHGAKIEY